MSEFDVRAVRSHIPTLASGVAFFDGPGGSQVPRRRSRRDPGCVDLADRQPQAGPKPERNADTIVGRDRR